jgi:hypothetical protein
MARTVSTERLVKDARRVLENPFWITTLKTEETYSRFYDDHDGEFDGELLVYFDKSGDAWVETTKKYNKALRFRDFLGGGQSQRVRNALMILALAIELDNEDHPQR